jgi:hypothetical protein
VSVLHCEFEEEERTLKGGKYNEKYKYNFYVFKEYFNIE